MAGYGAVLLLQQVMYVFRLTILEKPHKICTCKQSKSHDLFTFSGMKKAEWGLDSVVVALNDTNLEGFQDDFTGMMPDMFTWFQTESAVPRITCDSKGNALEFSRNGG